LLHDCRAFPNNYLPRGALLPQYAATPVKQEFAIRSEARILSLDDSVRQKTSTAEI
jgi:hypothetical protein